MSSQGRASPAQGRVPPVEGRRSLAGSQTSPARGRASLAEGRASLSRSGLRSRREEVAAQVAKLHWNLGGLTYEMAIRDHFRLDVLLRRAAMLQERELELAELDRLLTDDA